MTLMSTSTEVTACREFTEIGPMTKFLTAETLKNTVCGLQIFNSDSEVKNASKSRKCLQQANGSKPTRGAEPWSEYRQEKQ